MAVSNAVNNYTLQMPAGSEVSQGFTFTAAYPTYTIPYPLEATEWEYVVRATPTSGGSPLISVTTTANSQGALTVTVGSGLVVLTLLPAATASLAPGPYYHALWEYPGTSSAFTWWTGLLIVEGNPQP